VAGRVSPWRSIGWSYAALVAGVALLAFVPALGGVIERMNPFGLFEPGPLDDTAAKIMVTMVLAAWLAFAFTFVNVVGRSVVNERVPVEMQGRIFAAQHVLTNLASIPPILLAGLLADVIGVQPVLLMVAVMCALLAAFYSARNLAMPARAAS
jgi:MFS family permease